MANPDVFGQRLRELRGAAGLTLAELAAKAGLTPDAIVKLESGRRKPGWDTALALAAALGVDCTAFAVEPSPGGSAGDGADVMQAGEPEAPGVPAERPKGARRGGHKPKG